MRIVRFADGDQPGYGLVEDEIVYRLEGSPFGPFERGASIGALNEIEMLVPCQPSKIVAIGRNYVEHAREHQAEVPAEPLIFLNSDAARFVSGVNLMVDYGYVASVELGTRPALL